MIDLPKGYFRLRQIIGDSKVNPPIPALIPLSRSTWWNGVKEGRFPKAVKLSPRCTAWRVDEIYALIEQLSKTSKNQQTMK
ncbi:MAG: AlpA family phage regulatory protein [Bdellovibrionota bacterium]